VAGRALLVYCTQAAEVLSKSYVLV
jgi:hypothetical protein